MLDTFIKLFRLLSRRQRREFFLLQIVMLLASTTELFSTLSIMPFIALAGDPGIITSNAYFSMVHRFLGSPDHAEFLLWVGLGFLTLVTISNLLLFSAQFLINRYSFRLGGEISSALFEYYLSRDILFHGLNNSATLIQRVMRDSNVLSTGMIAPALRLNSRLFSIVLLATLIILVDPLAAVTTIFVLGAAYWFIFHVIRGAIYNNGRIISQYGQKRNRLLNESFGGIKDMKLYALEASYLGEYRATTRDSNRAEANNVILGESPFFLVETLVFGGMVLLTLYLYSSSGGMTTALPVLTLYAMAGLKIVPKLQQSYLAITKMRAAQAAFNHVFSDLKSAAGNRLQALTAESALTPTSSIELKDISFSYPAISKPLFNAFSARFNVGETTAVVGASGAGKSTLLSILMGLVQPDSGNILVDGEVITTDKLAGWRAAIGYVPQDVYLTDTSPAANIAFGVRKEDIDMERVMEAAKAAKIHDFIESLPDKYQARIGERGTQFSGGQVQRVGIARAFYRRVSVLILDEATSALDSETQQDILLNLKAAGWVRTVIMVTHRSETMAFSDNVIKLGSDNQIPADVQ